MLGELFAVIGGQCVHAGRKRLQQEDHGVRHGLRSLEWNVGNRRVARRALVHRNERLLLSGADDQVSLPVTKSRTLGHDVGAQINRDLVGNGAASLASPVSFFAGLLTAQGPMQCATGRLVSADAPVDALMVDAGLSIDFEVATDLLWAPGFSKLDATTAHVLAATRGPFLQALMRPCENSCACLGR